MSAQSITHLRRIGSGSVLMLGLIVGLIVLFCCGWLVGWNPTWRTLGVTPLEPHFFDMHVTLDYATCAAKGIDPYIPHACNLANFNLPPIWLWVSYLGLNGTDAPWLSVAMIAIALGVMVFLFKGRRGGDGLLALFAILSPSVMMGFERANPDLLIFAMAGGAALVYRQRKIGAVLATITLLSAGIVLKLFPMFCVALAARYNRRTLCFAAVITAIFLVYVLLIWKYLFLIRSNVPTTFMLSYGYKALFLGIDHLRAEAGLSPMGLAETWVPALTSIFVVIFSAALAVSNFRNGRMTCTVPDTAAGTAFFFGGGIYCGTFLLGTNFIYRLTFLLLCLPQLQEWQNQKDLDGARGTVVERGLLIALFAVLWLNGNSNGHTTFLLLPQLADWLLFFGLAAVLLSNLLNTLCARPPRRPR
ncbi:MAG TPA: hypothetical protein VEK74_06940 [Burkholderiaceae bacterium]|nr:hypothetical protein [Burkholderiaceae bacterium]